MPQAICIDKARLPKSFRSSLPHGHLAFGLIQIEQGIEGFCKQTVVLLYEERVNRLRGGLVQVETGRLHKHTGRPKTCPVVGLENLKVIAFDVNGHEVDEGSVWHELFKDG